MRESSESAQRDRGVTLKGNSGLHTIQVGEAGPWVVFCHGLFGQGKNWSQVAKQLGGRHRVLLPDLPNHGRSVWTDNWDYLGAADRLARELRSLDGPVALVGHSMGGKTAMALALRHPELVERLVVVDVSPVDYGPAEEFSAYLDAMISLHLPKYSQRADIAEALRPAVKDDTVRAFLMQNLHFEPGGWVWRPHLAALRRSLPAISGWPGVQVAAYPPYTGRTLWVAGGSSDYVGDKYAAEMTRLFPRTRRVTIKQAGHWVHADAPEVFTSVLEQFLDS
ncbi:MAG: alpha/beta fold hydrolase [Nocardioides sp.]